MPLFQVFHHDVEKDRLNSFSEDVFAKWPLHYRRVAVVEAPELGAVFELTNHIHDNWTKGPAVATLDEPRARSTSVGDVVIDADDKVYGVAGIGFTPLGTLKRCWYCHKPVYWWVSDAGTPIPNTVNTCKSCQDARLTSSDWGLPSLESSPDAAAEWAIDARMAEEPS